MLNFQGTVYIRNGITYSLPLIGGSIFLVNPGSILIINQHDGLCAIVQDRLHMDPRQRALYLFCGKRCDRLKALLWEGDGFLLLYKRMEAQGRFRWPRNSEEVRSLTWQQFDWLMSGLEIEQPKAFKVPENVDNISA